MSAKTVFTCALVLSLVGLNAGHGQSPSVMSSGGTYTPLPSPPAVVPDMRPPSQQSVTPDTNAPVADMQIPALSSWILNPYGEPKGPIGKSGPIRSEIYLHSGLDFPIGASKFTETLQPGWSLAGGLRTLLFNAPGDAAWVFDLGLLTTENHGRRPDITFPLSILVPGSTAGSSPGRVNFGVDPGVPGVSTHDLNRTYVTFGLGREWFFNPSFLPDCWHWRFGIDGGGRYGSEYMAFNEIRHRSDTIGALYAAIHSELERPINCGVLFFGVRLEYAYTWSDILQGTTIADVQDMNLLFNVGLRF